MAISERFVPLRQPIFGALLMLCLSVAFTTGVAQPKYRTFSQSALSEKKSKAGKPVGGELCFTFLNATADTVDGLVVRCNAHIRSVDNAGGFSSVTLRQGKNLYGHRRDGPAG